MADRFRIFSRDGYFIGQARTSVERSWALMTETSARFAISVYDTTKANKYLLNYGNWILVENSEGLPDWVGMIDNRGFDGGAVIVTAFTPERQFLYRRGPGVWTMNGSAGELFAQMIQYIDSLEETVLAVGNIDSRTNPMQETLNPTVITDNLARIVERSGEGYRWRPQVVKGKLTVYCDWYSNMLLETGLILYDGHNISGDHPLQESAPVNDVLAYGNGDNWTNRIIAVAQDQESKEDYGLRQTAFNVQTPSLDTLRQAASTVLNEVKQPKYSFPLSALNVNGTYGKLAPGALATLTRLVGEGFSEDGLGYKSNSIVVQSMDYNPASGYVALSL